jgi:hypothetical protein
MNILDRPNTRMITGVENIPADDFEFGNGPDQRLINFGQWFNPMMGSKEGAFPEEVMLCAFINHCLHQAGEWPKQVILSQTLSEREWHDTPIERAKIDVEILYN